MNKGLGRIKVFSKDLSDEGSHGTGNEEGREREGLARRRLAWLEFREDGNTGFLAPDAEELNSGETKELEKIKWHRKQLLEDIQVRTHTGTHLGTHPLGHMYSRPFWPIMAHAQPPPSPVPLGEARPEFPGRVLYLWVQWPGPS